MPPLSGGEVVRRFERHGWSIARLRGSHIVLTRPGTLVTSEPEEVGRSAPWNLSSHIHSLKMWLNGRLAMGLKKTNLLLDEELVETAKELTGTRFTKDVVDLALRRLVRNLRRRRILRLAGKVKWEGDLSAMRRGRRLA